MSVPTADGQRSRFGVNRTYEPYSDDPDYISGNERFISLIGLSGVDRLLDLACGIGTLSRLVLERRRETRVAGLDLSFEGLQICRHRLHDLETLRNDSSPVPGYVQASADRIPFTASSFDLVLMGHSIHMLPDYAVLLDEVHRVLETGGRFAFNSSFYAGTFVAGTEHIYHDWTKQALDYLRARDSELKRQGLPGIRRRRGRVAAAFSRPWLSPAEWEELLAGHGFEVEVRREQRVRLTQRSFESIGAYAGFAEVILSGYPVDVACEALEEAAGPTFVAEGISEVPRNWLEIVAVKRAGPPPVRYHETAER